MEYARSGKVIIRPKSFTHHWILSLLMLAVDLSESMEKAFFGALSLKQLESANPVQSRQHQDYVWVVRIRNVFCLITEVTEEKDL